MNELERTALNEILRTVTYIAEKLDEVELTIFERRKGMKPKRYPYSGEIESTFVKIDPELVEKVLRNTSYLENLLANRL